MASNKVQQKTCSTMEFFISRNACPGLIVLISGILLSVKGLYAQDLYKPYNVLQAYEQETRSASGRPGINYFQNYASYEIKAHFDPFRKILKGSQIIYYTNESPEPLNQLVIRLYQDHFKRGNIRDDQVSPYDLHDGVDIEYLKINGEEYDLTDNLLLNRTATNLIVWLRSPLLPGEEAEVSMAWSFNFPSLQQKRFGTYNQTSFFVAYWYPQIAVFDDIDGWDLTEFTGTQEFYNDFNHFDVEITVPNGFFVWAAGEWENPSKILEKPYLKKYQQAMESNEVIHIVTAEDIQEKEIFKKPGRTNTWEFSASSISDFSFAVSDSYLWDARSILIDTLSGRRVGMHAVYPEKRENFHHVTQLGAECLLYQSHSTFGKAYPFNKMTAFSGAGGMEYPMMINIEDPDMIDETIDLVSHELAHSYFPFLVGMNEKKYAWMDEGLVTLLAIDFPVHKNPLLQPVAESITANNSFLGEEQEIPPMIPSNQITGWSYRFHAYWRSSAAFFIMRNYLGKEIFRDVLVEFINRWAGKHPVPYDLFYTFNDITGKNLNWFWNAWFFKAGWADLAISEVQPENEGFTIVIINKGTLPVPLKLKLTYRDGSEEIIEKDINIWKDTDIYRLTKHTEKQLTEVYIGDIVIPDRDHDNNYHRVIQFKSNRPDQ